MARTKATIRTAEPEPEVKPAEATEAKPDLIVDIKPTAAHLAQCRKALAEHYKREGVDKKEIPVKVEAQLAHTFPRMQENCK